MRIKNTQNFEWAGQWWLPQSQDRYYGTLHYSPERGLELELIGGALNPAFEYEHNVISRFDPETRVTAIKTVDDEPATIWGKSGATEITVFHSIGTQKSLLSPSSNDSIHTSRYTSSYAVIGSHIDSSEKPVVASSSVSVEYLAGLLEQAALLKVTAEGYQVGDSSDWKRTRETAELDFDQNIRPAVGVQIDDIGAISLSQNWKGPSLKATPSGLVSTSEEQAQLKIHWTDPSSLASNISQLDKLTLLVSFATAGRRDLTNAEIELADTSQKPISLLLPCRTPLTNPAESTTFDPFFILSNAEFIELIPRSIKFVSNHYRLLNLTVELWEDTPGFVETEILLSSILLEAFHQDVYGVRRSKLTDEALRLLDEQFDDQIQKPKLHFKHMAVNCYAQVPSIVREKLVPDLRHWANNLTTTRNNLAHRALLNERETETARAAGQVALAVVTVLIFTKIGIPNAKIDETIEHHEKFRRIRKAAHRYLTNQQG